MELRWYGFLFEFHNNCAFHIAFYSLKTYQKFMIKTALCLLQLVLSFREK